ncbi:MAG: hypothetical protein PHI58_05525 [Candidatus Omnitrophica bacterium]|nr:hypothetical protein [Candidatus Omnitrophota bacterium]
MSNIVIIISVISVIWIGYFIWARNDAKKRRAEYNKKKDKPTFRTEEDLNEYAKPMDDEHHGKVDFDDAE